MIPAGCNGSVTWDYVLSAVFLSYLNQAEHFILNDGGGVVFRRDYLDEHAINKVSARC